MRLLIHQLNTKPDGEDGAGDPRDVTLFREKTVQIIGGSGTHTIEITLAEDASNFEPVPDLSDTLGPGIYSIPFPAKFIRVNSTGNTTAPEKVLIGAYLDD